MHAITTFIIDDEFQSRNFLHKMLQQYFPELQVAGEASSIKDGLKGIIEYNPGIVFLDIQLQDGTGFDLLTDLPLDKMRAVNQQIPGISVSRKCRFLSFHFINGDRNYLCSINKNYQVLFKRR